MMIVARNVKRSETELRDGESDLSARHAGIGFEGRAPGLVGFGRTVRRVANVAARSSMKIVAFNPFLGSMDLPTSVARHASPEDQVGDSDVVSIGAPLTAENSGLFGDDSLGAIRPEPLLQNHLPARCDVVASPHAAASTTGAKRRIFKVAFGQVLQVLGGHGPPHLLDPEVWNRLVPVSR